MYKKNIIIATILLTISIPSNAQPASCNQITSDKDDFTNEVTSRTSFINTVQITKRKSGSNNPQYSLSLSTVGLTVVVDGYGAIILFEDGEKLSKSAKIEVDAIESGFKYTAFIPLTNADIKLLKSKKISKYKLYIFEQTLSEVKANIFIEDVNCIINSEIF